MSSLKTSLVSLAGLMALAFGSAHADCVYPKAPATIPNGSTASEAEMATAAGLFKQYNADVTAYLACLQDETTSKSAGVSAGQVMQIKSMQSKKHNSAVDELETQLRGTHAIPLATDPQALRVFYADARPTLGHYLEYVSLPAAFDRMIPRT